MEKEKIASILAKVAFNTSQGIENHPEDLQVVEEWLSLGSENQGMFKKWCDPESSKKIAAAYFLRMMQNYTLASTASAIRYRVLGEQPAPHAKAYLDEWLDEDPKNQEFLHDITIGRLKGLARFLLFDFEGEMAMS